MTWSSTATRGRTGPRRPLGEPGGFGSLAFSIPLGFRTGRPFSPLSRAISARWAATVCSRAATLPSNSMTSAFSSVGESASRSPGGAILPGNQRSTGQESEKRAATSFAAGTQVVDMGLLTETATSAKELLGADGIVVVADSGYFKIEDIEACEKAGMTPYVPRPQRGPAVRAGLFRKEEFRYDPARDSVLCPAGHRLEAYSSSVIRRLKKVNHVNKEACGDCPLRARCTKGRFRTVSRYQHEAVLDRMQDRLAKRPDLLDRRREMAEHPFGSIKQWMNQGAFLMRGLENVRGEFSLTALAYNL